MAFFNAISCICIFALLAIAVGFILAYVLIRKRSPLKAVDFIRKFKKGNCAIVYLAVIPLYWIGHIYAGEDAFRSLFSAINETVSLVVLCYSTDSIELLMQDSGIYTVAVYFSFVLVAVNAMIFALSFLDQRRWAFQKKVSWELKPDKLLIVGNNEDNLKIYASEKKRGAMILDDMSDKDTMRLYAKQIAYISKASGQDPGKRSKAQCGNELERYCRKILRRTLEKDGRSCVIVINTEDDDRNLALCYKFLAALNEYIDKEKDGFSAYGIFSRVEIYVFGDPNYETLYNSIVDASSGCIHYVNKYRLIAADFIDRYPLTQFMTGKQIDYETSMLRPGVEVNVALIGFGKTNRQIFLTSVANNQFLTEENGEAALKPVHYYIFDKQNPQKNKNLNHSYNRFYNEFEQRIKDQRENGDISYLPFPAFPADEHYGEHSGELDVNSPTFYEKIRSALGDGNSFNYIVIGFGTDLENVDMAQKMIEKRSEWKLTNTYIFVKVRSGNDSYRIFKEKGCYLIGDEKSAVYNIDRIDNDAVNNMAIERNRFYELEHALRDDPDADPACVYTRADEKWFTRRSQIERESNIYACLSLRSKLHLMGLDYVIDGNGDSRPAIGEDDYFEIYAPGDKPEFVERGGKRFVEYTLDFKESRRKTMAIHEHMRWNSFMLSKGIVPASKEEILSDKVNNGRDYRLRRHGNLTTFEGLAEFRKMITKRDGGNESERDVIKYDYQLLDYAHYLLNNNREKKYKIVRRGE